MTDVVEKHRQLVGNLAKDPQEILESLGGHEVHLAHMALGLAGESGELVDLIKKGTINGHELDREKVLEEAGDVLFYLVGILSALRFTVEHAMTYNINKLTARYAQGYSDQASRERIDQYD